MNYKQGISREQMSMMSLECFIGSDNPVRVIDMLVEMLDMSKLGFTKTKFKKEGRPPYEGKVLLKLFYYGYLNRLRSSRKLEAECFRNVEVWWLINQLTPAYHTIADFRKDNPAALKKAFKVFIAFLRGENVFGGEVVALDGTKLRAQNNKKNNFNDEKFAKSLAYIDSKAEEYIKELEACDAQEDKEAAELKMKEVKEKLENLKERKKEYVQLEEIMHKSGEKQISMSDPESRSLPVKDGITDVCYNIQTVTDNKHNLIVEFDTVNTSDQGQMCPMITKAMIALEVKGITALTDKGYHVGKDLQDCKVANITTVTAYPEKNNKNIDPAYQTSKFIYDREQNTYTCPQGAVLTTNGTWYEKESKGKSGYLVRKYQTDKCLSCPVQSLCTKAKTKKREIERSEYQDVVDENNRRVDENMPLYKTRQHIAEPPFGTIKRGWGYTYTLLKSIKKVNGEMAIIFTMYNLRRAMSIFNVKELIAKLKAKKRGILCYLHPQGFMEYKRAA